MRATFEAGLPGTGPAPVHLHTGRPTPWSEGIVIRVEPDDSHVWIANAQPGWGYSSKIVIWNHAQFIVVIVSGACYLIRPDAPDEWRFIDDLATDAAITPDNELALVATYTDILALSQEGSVKWRRTIAVDGVEIVDVTNNLVEGRACLDPPDDWILFRIRTSSGTVA